MPGNSVKVKSYFDQITTKYKSLPIQIRASFWFLICTILQRSISIITTPVFTRLLTNDEYGKYSVFLSWLGILTCFVTMYIYSGIYPQAIVKFEKERSQYSSAMQGLTIVLVAVWLCVYIGLKTFWNNIFSLNTSQMLAMFVIMWANAIFGFWSAEQRVEYKYRRLVVITLIEAILQPVLCVVLIYLTADKVSGLVWGIAVATFVCYISLFIKQIIKGRVFFSKNVWLYTLRLAIPLIPHYISAVLLNNSDRIMIQKLVGEAESGIYSLAYTIASCGLLINQALLQTVSPWIFKKIKNKQLSDIKRIAYPSLVGVALVNIMVILFTPEIVRVFAPDSYYDAIWVMPPISMSVYFMFMYNLYSSFEFYYEKTNYVSTATAIGAFLNIVLNYICIKSFGYFAAGYTTLVCYMAFAISHYCFMKVICKTHINSVKVYNSRIITSISAVFIGFGFLIMLTYSITPLVRYGMATAILLGMIIEKNKIKSFIIQILEGRNAAGGIS